MKRSALVLTMIMLVIILTSCSMKKLEAGDKIATPDNNTPPLKGKWNIEKVIDSPYKKEKLERNVDLMDKQALFHKDAVIVGNKYILEPSYTVRNVEISDYLLYKFKIDREYLGIDEEDAKIVTILGENQYFYEFIKYKEDEMIIFAEEQFFFLKRSIEEISKEEINRYIAVERNIIRSSSVKELESLQSGVVLGIKTYKYDEINEIDDWEYKTIWIKSNNRAISSAYEMEDLLVPRKKGFWLIDVERENIDNTFIDKINSTQGTILNEKDELEPVQLYGRDIKPTILKDILYVGNDYISTEIINHSNNKKVLEVYAIDNLDKGVPIILSDLLGENDLKSFEDDAKSILNSDLDLFLNESNFGLVRRNGYWIMKGRVNYDSKGEQLYEDYNIRTIPPKELVNYDKLSIPWNIIKGRFPNAIDAFISPNEDIIVIDLRNEILVYPIQDKEILQQEIGRIKKSHSDTIIMAEWATGRYTELWEEEILKNNGQQINYK